MVKLTKKLENTTQIIKKVTHTRRTLCRTFCAGEAVRRFAVTSARTARAKGMSIFRQTELYPENLRLLGNEELIERFRRAPAGTTLRILGRLQINRLLASEITVIGPT